MENLVGAKVHRLLVPLCGQEANAFVRERQGKMVNLTFVCAASQRTVGFQVPMKEKYFLDYLASPPKQVKAGPLADEIAELTVNMLKLQTLSDASRRTQAVAVSVALTPELVAMFEAASSFSAGKLH